MSQVLKPLANGLGSEGRNAVIKSQGRGSSPGELAFRVCTVPGFRGTVEATGKSAPEGKERTLRASQLEIFQKLRGKRRLILNSPTGWGKTTEVVFLAADRLLTDPGAKVLILVPQRNIARGFTRPTTLRLPDGNTIDWRVGHDLCGETEAKTGRLTSWLGTPAASRELPDRVAVTTHAAFVAAFRRLNGSASLEKLGVVIDEAHHVLAAGQELGCNELGACVEALLERDASVWLTTAFFFRGDRLPILRDDHFRKFARVFIPFDAHLGEMRHLKGYSYDFVPYRQTVFPELDRLLSSSQEPTLIYAPPRGSRVLGVMSKRDFVDRVLGLARRHYGQRACILDLTEEDTRRDRVEYLHERGDQVSVLVTVGMMKEGTDWPSCARVIDLVPSQSDQERNQKFGRLMRDQEGKRVVRYLSFLPFSLTKGIERQREEVSSLFAHFHASLILENALNPIRVPTMTRDVENRGGADRGAFDVQHADLLGMFGSQQQLEIEEAVGKALVNHAAAREAEGRPLTWEEAEGVVRTTLSGLACADVVGRDNLVPLGKQIVLLWRRRRSPQLDVADLVANGFDKVWTVDALDSLKIFSAGVCGRSTFVELREVLGSYGLEAAERWARDFAVKYSPANLPSEKSRDPDERSDGQRLSNLRKAKLGRGTHTFYPSVEAILTDAGFAGILDVSDKRLAAEEWAKKFVAQYKPDKLPSEDSQDPEERADCFRLQKLRRAKGGQGDITYYPSVEDILEGAGFQDILKTAKEKAEDWARYFVTCYRPDALPRKRSPDPAERADYDKLRHLRDAAAGKGRSKLYPSVCRILVEGGFADVACPKVPASRVPAKTQVRPVESSVAGPRVPLLRAPSGKSARG